jgi:hypothetical protein
MTTAKDVQDAIKTIETVHLRRALDVMAARIEEVDLFARTMAAAAQPGKTMTIDEFNKKVDRLGDRLGRFMAFVESVSTRLVGCARYYGAFGGMKFVGCEVYRSKDKNEYCIGCEATALLETVLQPEKKGEPAE